jgi:hypothetical protein
MTRYTTAIISIITASTLCGCGYTTRILPQPRIHNSEELSGVKLTASVCTLTTPNNTFGDNAICIKADSPCYPLHETVRIKTIDSIDMAIASPDGSVVTRKQGPTESVVTKEIHRTYEDPDILLIVAEAAAVWGGVGSKTEEIMRVYREPYHSEENYPVPTPKETKYLKLNPDKLCSETTTYLIPTSFVEESSDGGKLLKSKYYHEGKLTVNVGLLNEKVGVTKTYEFDFIEDKNYWTIFNIPYGGH